MFRKGDEPIPGYRLEQFLGKGQFGEVWRTTAPGGTSAALKFIDLGGKQGIKEFRGVRRVKEIRHANLMPITALWMLDGEGNILGDRALETYDPDAPAVHATLVADSATARPEWLVVAMLLGKKNLFDRLNESQSQGMNGIPTDELLRYMEEAAKGIDYLNTAQHDLGEGCVAIQHCDIKPANIMLIGDSAVVCDFGLARVLSEAAMTATGMVGSPAYMAPECIYRKPGPGSDQYSLAVSYVELRTGQLPFNDLTYLAVVEANREGKLNLSKLTEAEQVVIRKATSLKPEDRYPSTLAMVHALQRAVEGSVDVRSSSPAAVWSIVLAAVAALLPLGIWLVVAAPWERTNPNEVTTLEKPQSYNIFFEPADVTVWLNGQPQTLQAGSMTIPIGDDERLLIEAKHASDYTPLKKEFSLDELRAASFRVRLRRSASSYEREAVSQWDAGDRAAAAKAYRQAIDADPSLAEAEARLLKHHAKSVPALEFTSDGRWLVSAGDDGLACLWPVKDMTAVQTKPLALQGHKQDEPIETVSLSHDGRWLLTGSWDNQAILWDLATPDPNTSARKLELHTEDVLAVEISRDQKWLITASSDGSLALWPFSATTGAGQPILLPGHQAEVDAMRSSRDGRWLVSMDADGKTLRWDLHATDPATAAVELAIVPHRRNLLQLSADGKWLVTGTDEGALVSVPLDGPGSAAEYLVSNASIEAITFEPSGERLLVGDAEGNVYRYRFTPEGKAELLAPMIRHAGPCTSLATSEAGDFCVTGSWDQTARFWLFSADEAKVPLSLRLGGKNGRVMAVAISPDGKWIAAATDDGTVLAWDVARLKLILQATGGEPPSGKPTVET